MPRRRAQIRHRGAHHVARAKIGFHFQHLGFGPHEVEYADEIRERRGGHALRALEQRQRHRALRLVGIRRHGNSIAPGRRHGETLGAGVKHVGGGGVEESRHRVVELLGYAAAEELRFVHEVQVG